MNYRVLRIGVFSTWEEVVAPVADDIANPLSPISVLAKLMG